MELENMDENLKNLIEQLTNRLDYITFEETDEPFNVDEVKLIVSLLEIYSPSKEKFNVEKSYKKFLDRISDTQKEKGS